MASHILSTCGEVTRSDLRFQKALHILHTLRITGQAAISVHLPVSHPSFLLVKFLVFTCHSVLRYTVRNRIGGGFCAHAKAVTPDFNNSAAYRGPIRVSEDTVIPQGNVWMTAQTQTSSSSIRVGEDVHIGNECRWYHGPFLRI